MIRCYFTAVLVCDGCVLVHRDSPGREEGLWLVEIRVPLESVQVVLLHCEWILPVLSPGDAGCVQLVRSGMSFSISILL